MSPGAREDVLIRGDHQPPQTLQSRGCGRPGDLISLPQQFLSSQNISQNETRTFVHLWAKYRYGIFDETGEAGSTLWPSFPARDQATPGDLAGSQAEAVTRYSDSSEAGLALTKHNIICRGRSALSVIKSHRDFQGPRLRRTLETGLRLRVVTEAGPRYVLALDTSGLMAASGHWVWVTKAAHKFIRLDLPENSELAIVTFSSTAQLEHSMVRVAGEEERGVLADTIPGRYHLDTGNPGPGCVTCVMETLGQMWGDRGLDLVMITLDQVMAGESEARVAEMAARNNIRVSTVLLPSSNTSDAAVMFHDTLARATRGLSRSLQRSQWDIDLLFGLTTALSEILQNSDEKFSEILVHTAEYFSESQDDESEGVFVIDESLGHDSFFGVYTRDEEDHLIKSVTFEDSDGQIYGPFTKISSAMDPFNIKTINYVGAEAPFDNVGFNHTRPNMFITFCLF